MKIAIVITFALTGCLDSLVDNPCDDGYVLSAQDACILDEPEDTDTPTDPVIPPTDPIVPPPMPPGLTPPTQPEVAEPTTPPPPCGDEP